MRRLRRQLALRLTFVVAALGAGDGEHGIELIRRLRDHAATARVPIIVLTGRVFGGHQERAIEAGCDVFLTTPLSPDVLAAHIRHAIGGTA